MFSTRVHVTLFSSGSGFLGAGGGASSSTVIKTSVFVDATVELVSPATWDSPVGQETNIYFMNLSFKLQFIQICLF